MSGKGLPHLSNFKAIPNNYEVAMIMNNFKTKIDQARRKKQKSRRESIDVHFENPKRNYMMEERCTEIEKANRILFIKIADIGKKKSKAKAPSERHSKSLSMVARKQQVEEIEKENVMLFGRIKNQRAFMSFEESNREYLKNKEMRQRISNAHKNITPDWHI
jgi:hypothetical protein